MTLRAPHRATEKKRKIELSVIVSDTGIPCGLTQAVKVIQAIIKVTFRLCALYCLVTSWSNHDRRIMSKNQGVYTALKSAVNVFCFSFLDEFMSGWTLYAVLSLWFSVNAKSPICN